MARPGPSPVYTTTANTNGADVRTLTTASPGATDSVATKLPLGAVGLGGGSNISYARPEQTVAPADATGAILPAGSAFGWGWAMNPLAVGIKTAAGDGWRLLAGTTSVTLHYSRDGGLLTGNPTATVTVVVFRVNSGFNSYLELGRAASTGVQFTTTEQTRVIDVTTAAADFASDDFLYIEIHVEKTAGGNDNGAHIRTNSTTATRLTALPQYERRYQAALADAAPAADALTRLFTGARALADAPAAVGDAVSRVRSAARSLADSAPAADAFARQFAGSRALVDASAVTDAVARSATYARTIADAAPAADALQRQFTGARNLADAAPAADTLQRQFTGARSLADAAPAADALARAATYARTLADTVPLTDAVTRVRAALRSLADTAPAVADSVARRFTGTRSLADTSAITDAIQRAFTGSRTLADAIPLADAVTRKVTAARSLADSAPAVDALARAAIFARSLADSAPAVADLLQRQFAGTRMLTHSLPVADTLQRAATFARDLDDDLSNGATPPAPIVVRTTVLIFDD